MDDHAGGPHRHLSRRSLIATGALGRRGVGRVRPDDRHRVRRQPRPGPPTGVTKKITIYAEALPGEPLRLRARARPGDRPGPVLEMYEGDTLEITLVNTTDPAAVHPPARRRLQHRLRRQPAQRLVQQPRRDADLRLALARDDRRGGPAVHAGQRRLLALPRPRDGHRPRHRRRRARASTAR